MITGVRILEFLKFVLWDSLIRSYWVSGRSGDTIWCFRPALTDLGSTGQHSAAWEKTHLGGRSDYMCILLTTWLKCNKCQSSLPNSITALLQADVGTWPPPFGENLMRTSSLVVRGQQGLICSMPLDLLKLGSRNCPRAAWMKGLPSVQTQVTSDSFTERGGQKSFFL